MKKYYDRKLFLLPMIFCLLLVANCLLPVTSLAQTDSTPVKNKVAIFAPLYLDSAFDDLNEYRYTKNVFPKFINPGLEFYEGAQLALDSLAKENKELEVYIYDTRSTKESLEQQLNKPELKDVGLIIAQCGPSEVREFAEAGLRLNIPVINTNMPNDGGASGNPFFVVLNPTLKTQCEGIYKYAQRYHSTSPVVIFRKKGGSEDQIKTYFDDYSKNTMTIPLKIKYVELTDSFTVYQLKKSLDSTRHTFCIAGSLDANFGRRLALQLASISSDYPTSVMGMPTWDAIKDFSKPEFKGIEIIYGNPFYNAKMDKASLSVTNHFNTVMYARPTDMVFRGYEVTMKFSKLLLQYGKDLSSNLGNKQFKIFTDFDIQPVLNKQNMSLDYFENKKLYFLKWQDGIIKGVNSL